MEDEPVYLPHTSPNFFDCIDSAAEAVWDDGEDPSQAEAYKCRVGKAYVPHLVSVVEEAWWEQYEDGYEVEVPEDIAQDLNSVYERLLEAAPTIWTPTNERVMLPPIECPRCGISSDEEYPQDLEGEYSYCFRGAED